MNGAKQAAERKKLLKILDTEKGETHKEKSMWKDEQVAVERLAERFS